MSFLNPALLAFTAAVAVPILIHFLNRRRFRRVSWAAMRFILASLEKNRRRMELEDWILLAVRCLLVALLALALARPAWRSAAAFLESGRAAGVILLDTSASLEAGDGTRTAFDQAREAAEGAVDAFASGSSLAVLLTGDRVVGPIGEPTYDLNLVRKTLREAEQTDLATDHAVGVARALEILKDQTALRKEVILVTDRQAWGWRHWSETAAALGEVARDTRLRVVLVGDRLEDDLAVTDLTRSAGFASAREPLRFRAEIRNHGATAVRQVRATLHVDRGPAVDEAVIERLDPGQSRRVTFFARFPGPGYHAVSVRLPPDRLAGDDERTWMVRVLDTVRILVVNGQPEANAAFFLRHALQPVPVDAVPEYVLQPRVISPAQLAFTRLADFDAVILTEVATLATPAVDALAGYVRDGGALLCFPGTQAQAPFYNTELVQRAGLLPATLGEVRGQPDPAVPTDTSFSLQAGPYEHPVFALWNENQGGSLVAARFRAAWSLEPAPARTNAVAPAGPGQVMIRFADGSPAAVEGVAGRGRVMVFAGTAGTAWNDLPVRPAFVPFLHRSLAALVEADKGVLNGPVGAPVSLRLPGELIGRDVIVRAAGTPERHYTRTPGGGGQAGEARLAFDEVFRAGAYRVGLPGEASVLAGFAAQADPQEYDLTPLTPERRDEIARVAQVVDWVPGTDLRTAFDRERVGAEFWLPLVVGVSLLGIFEVWLAQRFSRSK